MQWLVKDNELLYTDDEGITHNPSPRSVWNHFHDKPIPGLPSLSEMGFNCSSKYLTVLIRLVDSDSGSFGKLSLGARNHLGKTIELADDHVSDHVVYNNVWMPLAEGAMREIRDVLRKYNLEIGVPLTPKQYLICVRDLSNYAWFRIECEYSASDWSQGSSAGSQSESYRFIATLADYQVRGSNWLTMMRESDVGIILGDSMGLGKTIQVIKTICDLIEDNPVSRTLVVCPTALIENWCREIEKFTCGVTYMVHVGSTRSRNYRSYTASIMLTTYDVARMDASILSFVDWDLMVLDEAQFIKNPKSQRTLAIKSIPRKASIAMTGTPFENHVTDIWSLFDFCMPDFLGTIAEFNSAFSDDGPSAIRLGRLIAPLLLRRTLKDIPNDLPPIITLPMPIALSEKEAEEYERRKTEYIETGSAFGAIGNLITDLAAPPSSDRFLSKLKYEYFGTVMDEVAANNEKIIVFAERKATIATLERAYMSRFPVFTLTGETPNSIRQETVDDFSSKNGTAMLICNPTVGGAGLNITAANHVFHFSMQWNPAKFDQADARAHRRGQDKTVIAHYPYYASTIEEYMWDKVATKRELASEIVVGNQAESTAQDIANALSMSPVREAF